MRDKYEKEEHIKKDDILFIYAEVCEEQKKISNNIEEKEVKEAISFFENVGNFIRNKINTSRDKKIAKRIFKIVKINSKDNMGVGRIKYLKEDGKVILNLNEKQTEVLEKLTGADIFYAFDDNKKQSKMEKPLYKNPLTRGYIRY